MIPVIKEILAGIPTNLNAEYFIWAGAQLLVLGGAWLFLRRIKGRKVTYLYDSSVFGMDMGATTLPATVVIAIALLGAAAPTALVCSTIFIVTARLCFAFLLSCISHFRQASQSH